MTYVLAQTTPTPATAEQLKEAFRAVKGLTAVDAQKTARQAYGIIRRGLQENDAVLLKEGLRAQGVGVETVPEGQLPPLPEPKFTRRLELKPDTLLVYDSIGRPVPVEWKHVTLYAAGIVSRVNIVSAPADEIEVSSDLNSWTKRDVVNKLHHRLDTTSQFVLDIVLTGGAMRFQIESREFLYKYAVDRPDLDPHQRMAELMRMLCQGAPHASLNRGATQVRDLAPLPLLYASKGIFADESAWWLWLKARPTELAA